VAKVSLALAVALGLLFSVVPAAQAPAQEEVGTCVFINELHYDNDGADAGEAIEVAGPAGTDLTGWSVVLYNGNGGAPYDTFALSGAIPDEGETGFGALSFPRAGIQNGSPDGLALVDSSSQVVQFLSYEGVLTAIGGPADGMTSTDIGVTEPSDGPIGLSLQLTGENPGSSYEEFAWSGPTDDSFGATNAGQTFAEGACAAGEAPPPTPPAPEGLKINEIDYDQASTDTGEFVEIFNSGTEAVDLGGFELRLVNGTGGGASIYATITLPDNTLAAGDFFVVCANSAATPNCDLDVSPDTNLIQNGAPDAVAIATQESAALVDTLSYEGVTGAPYTENTGVGLEDDPGVDFAGLSRRPDGTDTDNNASDFDLVCVTPGEPNTDATTDCPNPTPPVPKEIYEVQGSGSSSPLVGWNVIIDGIVVGDFQGNELLNGFHLQEASGDGLENTSDGIFVFAPDAPDVSPGDYVVVTGTVAEFDNLTEITNVTEITVPPDAVPPSDEIGPIDPTPVSLPVEEQSDWEKYEGMLVTSEQDLYISEFFNFDRTNEIVLTTDRQFQGTQIAEPGPAANAVAAANALARVTLDDGRTTQNPDPALHPDGDVFTLTNTFRGGDILRNVTGVLHESRPYAAFFPPSINYRIQPTQGATHVAVNPRPETPGALGGDVKVATFNVLNFFTHLNNPFTTADDTCGPTGNLECRGANNLQEYERQLDKLVAGIIALDADVVGIQEIENDIHGADVDGSQAHDAVLKLVDALNGADEEWTWAWGGPANHYNDYPVRNEIIYRTEAVMPVGDPVALVHEAFDSTRPGDIEPVGRPPLAQTFRPLVDQGSRQPFTVVVNHFKSKGSPCDGFVPPGFEGDDPDTGDGQANCNLTRVAQAEALLDFIDVLDDDSSGVLAIGDFNSYALEDPIVTLEEGGLTDLVKSAFGTDSYSYLFDGQLGTLDYILATRSILNRVEGVTVFHINADEPDILDYDTSFKRPAQDALYEDLPYRVSDHDPVIVGLKFGGPRGR